MAERARLTDDDIARELESLDDKQLAQDIDKEAKSIWKKEENAYTKNMNDDYGGHDQLIDQCIVAFSAGSKCFDEANYEFVTVEPLLEKKVRNFDVLMLNEKEELGIFVECKSGLYDIPSEVSDVYGKIEDLAENLIYLQGKISCSLKRQEYVLCVPSQYVESVMREIERREKSGQIDCGKDALLLIWGVNMFNRPSIQLCSRMDSPRKKESKQHMNSHLTRLLSDGIDTSAREIMSPVYPSSHPLKQASKFIEWVVKANIKADNTLWAFDRDMPSAYFKNRKNLPHYANEEIGQGLADRFTREGLSKGLLSISEEDHAKLLFASKGKSMSTILRTYQRDFTVAAVKEIVNRKARRTVFEKYREKHPPLDSFPVGSSF